MAGVAVHYDEALDVYVYWIFVPDYEERFGYLHAV